MIMNKNIEILILKFICNYWKEYSDNAVRYFYKKCVFKHNLITF